MLGFVLESGLEAIIFDDRDPRLALNLELGTAAEPS